MNLKLSGEVIRTRPEPSIETLAVIPFVEFIWFLSITSTIMRQSVSVKVISGIIGLYGVLGSI